MSDADEVLDELEPQPAHEALPVSRRQTLRALASVGALTTVGSASGQSAGTVRADEAYFANYGWEPSAEGGTLTIDGGEYTFDGSEEIGLDDGGVGTELVTPSGQASELIGPSGQVLWEGLSAIPDSGMFQDPIYQYWAGSYDGGDGDSPFDYPEVLTDSTATAVGAPFFRADQSGFTAGEYDGIDDGHDALTGQLPTGAVGVSMAALVYVPTAHRGRVFSYGDGNVGSSIALGVRGDNTVEATVQGSSYSFATGGTYSTGEWITIGASFNSDTANSVLNGSFVATDGGDTYNISNQDAGIAYRGFASLDWFDGYVAEIIVSATNEPEQAFADYHNDRLG